MGAIAHSLIFLLALALPAPRDIVSKMAADLSSDNPSSFLSAISKSMAGYEELAQDIRAICGDYEIASSIEVLDEKESTIEVDWYLELRPRSGVGPLIRRRERVKLAFGESGKRRVVTSLQPSSLFAPP